MVRCPMSEILLLTVFPLLVGLAAASDLLTMTIPNRVSILLAAGFVACGLLVGLAPVDAVLHLASGALVLAVGFALFAAGWIGGGDAKLAAAIALWLGFGCLPDFLLTATLAGGALTLIILVIRRVPLPAFALGWTWASRLHDHRTGVPYGIALAAAALLVYPSSTIWRVAF
jgi:prepilin peptidase CpaA